MESDWWMKVGLMGIGGEKGDGGFGEGYVKPLLLRPICHKC